MDNSLAKSLAALGIFLSGLILLIYFSNKYKYINLEFQSFQGDFIERKDLGKLVYTEGTVKRVFQNKQNMFFLTIESEERDIGVSLFPSFGRLKYIPEKGDLIRVEGILEKYQDQFQISPLSKDSIHLIKAADKNPIFLKKYPNVSISELKYYMGETVLIKNVQVVKSSSFISRKGNKILSFSITDGNEEISGIFSWNNSSLKKLKEGHRITLLAEVSTYQGDISLLGESVYAGEF